MTSHMRSFQGEYPAPPPKATSNFHGVPAGRYVRKLAGLCGSIDLPSIVTT